MAGRSHLRVDQPPPELVHRLLALDELRGGVGVELLQAVYGVARLDWGRARGSGEGEGEG